MPPGINVEKHQKIGYSIVSATVSELVYDRDSKSRGRKPVWVRLPPVAHYAKSKITRYKF